MFHYIYSYLITGLILAAIDDLFLLPRYVKKNPRDSFLLNVLKWRVLLSIIIIVAWLPITLNILYHVLVWDESDGK